MSAREQILELQQRMGESIIGQEHVVERLLLVLLCNGNVLVEGLPGLAKTRAVKSLAKNLETEFSRIQFTPDLLPSDITGSEMYLGEGAEERFVFQPGPIFANIVLADEVNRAPAKVQAALLEAAAVYGHGDPESHRAGRHLPITGSANGSLSHACLY